MTTDVETLPADATPAARVPAEAAPVLVSVEGVTKRYGSLTAVDELSFEVRDGEFFTLLGPSGCGKSTTLMALAGFEQVDAGTIHLAGRDITHAKPERREMGVVFQNYALFPHMTVLANVLFPLRMRGIGGPGAEAKARETLELVELEESRYGLRPTQLSGGQQQRVALARAMVFDPAVLLMDEPLSALDRRLRHNLQFQLRHLQARLNTTVIYVTHDQEEALALSDRIGVMRAGRFDQLAPPADVYGEPATAFVAGFLGNSNQAPVTVLRRAEQVTTVQMGGEEGCELRVADGVDVSGAEAVQLFIRPERIALSSEPADAAHERCQGTVEDVAFMGDHVRVEVRVPGGATWTVPVPAEQALATLGRVRPGEIVGLRWRLDAARLLPAD